MNIVSFYETPGVRGGVESLTLRLDKALTTGGHRFVTVLAGPSTQDRAWETRLSHVRVGPAPSLSWKRMPINGIAFAKFVVAVVHRENPDIIVVNWTPLAWLIRTLQKLRLIKMSLVLIIWEHGGLAEISTSTVSKPYRWVYFKGLRMADHIICGGSDYARALFEQSGVSVTAIGLPLNLPLPTMSRPLPSMFRIVFVGRLVNEKRLDRLLLACAKLPDTVDWTLQLVGEGSDRTTLVGMAESLGIERHCIWSGWQADPWGVIDSATIMALPSDHEGFSAAMIEAMARGIPVLATDCNFGPRSVIENGLNGWLVDRNDEAFAQQLRRLALGEISIPSPTVVAQTMGQFDAMHVANRFVTVCQNALQASRAV